MKSAATSRPRFQRLTLLPPRQFFMCGADLAFWLRSARADARLARLRSQYGTQEAFDRLYTQTADPWGYLVPAFRYQRLKYAKLLALLPARCYARGLDIGCGLGLFTRMLAPYVEEMVGIELSQVAVEQAARLSPDLPQVHFAQGSLLELGACDLGLFDLVVLADTVYYVSPLPPETLTCLVTQIEKLLRPGGIVLLANHYFFDLDPQSRHVRHIHAAFAEHGGLRLVEEQRHPFFLASLLEKRA
jgi:SAM-dependent methyltransferase